MVQCDHRKPLEVCRKSLIMNPSSQRHLRAPGPPKQDGGGEPSCTAPNKWPNSWAATMIPEKPPVSSTMATELTFSSLLLTTQAPPTQAKPAVPLLHSPNLLVLRHMSNLKESFFSTKYLTKLISQDVPTSCSKNGSKLAEN